MAIAVCVKQVPTDIDKSTFENGVIDREKSRYKINPLDLYALEAALRLKEVINEPVWVLSMGTMRSAESLKECISLGADEIVLLNDPCFAGSDTQATSYILSKALCKIGSIRAVFCGKYSTDGSTGQVGPELAEKLQFNLIQNLTNFETNDSGYINYFRTTDKGIVKGKTELPAVFIVDRMSGECRVATVNGVLRAQNRQPKIWNRDYIDADRTKCGFEGSFTKVGKILNVNRLKICSNTITGSVSDIAESIIKEIRMKHSEIAINCLKGKQEVRRNIIKKSIDFYAADNDLLQSKILVYAEVNKDVVQESAFQLIGKIRSQASEEDISVVVISPNTPQNIEEVSDYGADKVFIVPLKVENTGNEEVFADILSTLVLKMRPMVFLLAATDFGRAVGAILASKLNVGLTADCTEIEFDSNSGILRQMRPVFCGSKKAEIVCVKSATQMATIRPNVFPLKKVEGENKTTIIKLKDYKNKLKERNEELIFENLNLLNKASIVFVGGRGLKEKSNYMKLKNLASRFGGNVGATRAVVDLGWARSEEQIGLTGVNLIADLCILFGVSGAPEHIAGLTNVKKIIAINIDPHAVVFSHSDIRIVADAVRILKAIEEKVAL